MMEQKIEYIHFSPVKRGYVDDPLHWRYSSARNYAGQTSLIDVVTQWKYRCLTRCFRRYTSFTRSAW